MKRIANSIRLGAVMACGAVQLHLFAAEIIAHRGASADAPENTLASFKRAWDQKADAIELDLWLSKDGRLIVFHDADTKRFEGKARRISELQWKELQEVDVGSWKGQEFAKERMPKLESVLGTIPEGRRALLEIKCGPEILPELVRVLRQASRPPKELAIISFNFEVLKQSKRLFPRIDHYYLLGYQRDAVTGQLPEIEFAIQRCQGAGLDGLDLHFAWPIDREFAGKVRAAGLRLMTWTVDDVAVARRQVEAGVEGITTNRPQWLREQLQGSSNSKVE